ncbi:MAG: chemotaxis protein [Chlorobiaceae bacterium]|nr:chemotaxis protein [Chlorobiaceae bacterium]
MNTGHKKSAFHTKHWDTIPTYRFYPVRESFIIGTLVFIVVSITTSFIYYYTLDALKGEIREGLARTAAVVALSVDGDLHETFHSPTQESTPEYANAILPLARALRADPSISYVYTVILRDGQPMFILDATPPGDVNHDGIDEKSHIMQECKNPTTVMLDALRRHRVLTEQEPYQDMWGASISGYAPFYDSGGRFAGIVGVDIKADNYYKRLEPIRRATVRAIVTGFFTAFVVGALVWFMRNFSRVINEKRHNLYEELFQGQLPQNDKVSDR